MNAEKVDYCSIKNCTIYKYKKPTYLGFTFCFDLDEPYISFSFIWWSIYYYLDY